MGIGSEIRAVDETVKVVARHGEMTEWSLIEGRELSDGGEDGCSGGGRRRSYEVGPVALERGLYLAQGMMKAG